MSTPDSKELVVYTPGALASHSNDSNSSKRRRIESTPASAPAPRSNAIPSFFPFSFLFTTITLSVSTPSSSSSSSSAPSDDAHFTVFLSTGEDIKTILCSLPSSEFNKRAKPLIQAQNSKLDIKNVYKAIKIAKDYEKYKPRNGWTKVGSVCYRLSKKDMDDLKAYVAEKEKKK